MPIDTISKMFQFYFEHIRYSFAYKHFANFCSKHLQARLNSDSRDKSFTESSDMNNVSIISFSRYQIFADYILSHV